MGEIKHRGFSLVISVPLVPWKTIRLSVARFLAYPHKGTTATSVHG